MQKQSGLAETPFWQRKRLADMTPAEWESLCDGCGLCCLHKIMDEDSNDIAVTDVACRLLDLDTCRCSDYPNRRRHVPDCVHLTPETTANLNWLPSTCAYRLVDQGRDLFDWHPLVSGDPETVHRAGISARGAAVSEDDVDDLEDHVQAWLDAGADPFAARKKRNRG